MILSKSRRTALLCMSVFLWFNTTVGQSPYELQFSDAVVISAGVGSVITGFLLDDRVAPLTLAEVALSDENDINGFDRFAVRNYSSKAKAGSDILLIGSFALPVPLIFNKQIQRDFWTLGVLYAEAASLTAGTVLITKSTVLRKRPYVYNESVPSDIRLKKDGQFSFFSGHTSVTAMNAFFFAKVFSDYFPASKYRPVVWSAAVLIPAATGFLRVEAGRHFPTDVLVGYAAGAAVGYLVPTLHKKRQSKNKSAGLRFLLSPGSARIVLQLD